LAAASLAAQELVASLSPTNSSRAPEQDLSPTTDEV